VIVHLFGGPSGTLGGQLCCQPRHLAPEKRELLQGRWVRLTCHIQSMTDLRGGRQVVLGAAKPVRPARRWKRATWPGGRKRQHGGVLPVRLLRSHGLESHGYERTTSWEYGLRGGGHPPPTCARVGARWHGPAVSTIETVSSPSVPSVRPAVPRDPSKALGHLLAEGVTWGDALEWLPALPKESVDLFFTSPPYADARAYSKIHPDHYVDWFLPFAEAMLEATSDTGSLIINIKNRVAGSGSLRGQRHPYVYQLVIALQQMGWRWLETYIWAKPNAIPGRFGPRTKDSFEYVYHFAKGAKPHFDLDAIRVPYKADAEEIARRAKDTLGRRSTEAGFGRDRTKTYLLGGADPGNVVSVPQSYNQHKGFAHTALMPEGLASFFVRAASPQGGIVLDPFAGGSTTAAVARQLGRQAGGLELHRDFVVEGRRRLSEITADDVVLDLEGELIEVGVG